MSRRGALAAGGLVLALAWGLVAAGFGMTGHMTAHMAVTALAAPLIAWGLAGSRADPATRWPWLAPLPVSLVEFAAVWGWHAPAARRLAEGSLAGAALEQASFLAAGLLLWSAALGTRGAGAAARRAAGVGALLLTSMHMTLLGALIGLAPRALYGGEGLICGDWRLSPLADQQLGAALMLTIGAGAYLLGGLVMLAELLRAPAGEARA